jgi:hypothetical protein
VPIAKLDIDLLGHSLVESMLALVQESMHKQGRDNVQRSEEVSKARLCQHTTCRASFGPVKDMLKVSNCRGYVTDAPKKTARSLHLWAARY